MLGYIVLYLFICIATIAYKHKGVEITSFEDELLLVVIVTPVIYLIYKKL